MCGKVKSCNAWLSNIQKIEMLLSKFLRMEDIVEVELEYKENTGQAVFIARYEVSEIQGDRICGKKQYMEQISEITASAGTCSSFCKRKNEIQFVVELESGLTAMRRKKEAIV